MVVISKQFPRFKKIFFFKIFFLKNFQNFFLGRFGTQKKFFLGSPRPPKIGVFGGFGGPFENFEKKKFSKLKKKFLVFWLPNFVVRYVRLVLWVTFPHLMIRKNFLKKFLFKFFVKKSTKKKNFENFFGAFFYQNRGKRCVTKT